MQVTIIVKKRYILPYKEFYVVNCIYEDFLKYFFQKQYDLKKNEISVKRCNISMYFQYYEKVCKRMGLNVNNKH